MVLLAGYAGSYPGGAPIWQSGISLGLRWSLIPAVYVGARYTLIPAFEHEVDAARLSISRRPVEVVLGYAAPSRIAFSTELSFIAEQSVRETLRTDPSFEPTPAKTHWALGIGTRLGLIFTPWPAVSAALRGGVDFMLNRPSYSTDEQPVLAPAAVRPGVDFEVGVGVW